MLYDGNGVGLWQTNVVKDVARGPFYIQFRDDGGFTLHAKDDGTVWSSGLSTTDTLSTNTVSTLRNQMIMSSWSGSVELIMQADGNMVVYKKGRSGMEYVR